MNKRDLVLDTTVRICFYRFQCHNEINEDYFSNLSLLYQSFAPKYNREAAFKSGAGAGKSGSFFFFSHDNKFIIKTMSATELKLYLRLLPCFKDHYKHHPFSMLAKIFGVFTVKSTKTGPVHLILMENTLRFKRKEDLKYIFDLKGSMVGRKTKGDTKASTVLKDKNLLEILNKRPDLVNLSDVEKLQLKRIMQKDIDFLKS